MYGKLVGEFFECLGRVVVGAEVIVNGPFKKPTGLVGSYLIVAVEGAEFGPMAAYRDCDLVAAELSASGIRALPYRAFYGCSSLAAVAFPPELESIGELCLCFCDALHVIDLTVTRLRKLGRMAFGWSGVVRVSVPASLLEMGEYTFADTLLRVLDLSACAGIRIEKQAGAQSMELWLPREGFVDAAKAFILLAPVAVLRGDVGETEINELLPSLEGRGIDRLQVVSSRIGVFEWHRAQQPVLVELTDPEVVTTPASVTMTAWRPVPVEWWPYLRVIDLSGMTLGSLPAGASLRNFFWLEKAVLPAGLRVLPSGLFLGCVRLKSVVTGLTTLEEIGPNACGRCRSLEAFLFPPTLREVSDAFWGTMIGSIDLSGTAAESVEILGMVFLAELILSRRCVLVTVKAVPSLRRVTFGASRSGSAVRWHPREVRFEGLSAGADFSPGLLEAHVYAEVACELGRETVPFPPPS
jgi:hypothetical protein